MKTFSKLLAVLTVVSAGVLAQAQNNDQQFTVPRTKTWITMSLNAYVESKDIILDVDGKLMGYIKIHRIVIKNDDDKIVYDTQGKLSSFDIKTDAPFRIPLMKPLEFSHIQIFAESMNATMNLSVFVQAAGGGQGPLPPPVDFEPPPIVVGPGQPGGGHGHGHGNGNGNGKPPFGNTQVSFAFVCDVNSITVVSNNLSNGVENREVLPIKSTPTSEYCAYLTNQWTAQFQNGLKQNQMISACDGKTLNRLTLATNGIITKNSSLPTSNSQTCRSQSQALNKFSQPFVSICNPDSIYSVTNTMWEVTWWENYTTDFKSPTRNLSAGDTVKMTDDLRIYTSSKGYTYVNLKVETTDDTQLFKGSRYGFFISELEKDPALSKIVECFEK